MPKILIVDDDARLLKMLLRTLTYEGFRVETAGDGQQALIQIQNFRPDVIVLDWLMPGLDGMQVMQRLRQMNQQIMVLMLTARDAVEDRVEGLESGADDYMVKPFAPIELLARIQALLRRSQTVRRQATLEFADLYLDPETRQVRRGAREIELTPKEFDLLAYLMAHPRQVARRETLLQEIWGYDFGGDDNVLEVYIGYLRKKLEADGEARLIQTARGVGYTLREV